MRFTKKNKQNLSQKLALNRLIAAVSVALISVSGVAHAVTLTPNEINALNKSPDAGQILKEIERDLEVKPLPEAPVIEAAPLEEDQGEKIVIKQFKFVGNKVISETDLQEALSSLTNHEITVTQLKTCVDLVAAFYRQKGYLAVATLPEQDITDGVVTVNIVEASYGSLKIDGEYGKDYKRIRPSVIERVVNGTMQKGAALNQDDLDRALAVTQKMAGFNLSANYQAGEKEGTTDVLVTVKDKPLFSGAVSADNTGGRSTGRHKQTVTLGFASPLGFGDSLNFVGLHSRGTDYVSASYSLPVGAKGVQVGMNASYLAYDVILGGEIAAIKPKGESKTVGLDLNYPLMSSPKGNLNLGLNYDHKTFLNQIIASDVYINSSNYSVDVASIALTGTLNDEFLAGAVNSASVNIGRGNVDMTGSGASLTPPHQQTDFEGANTQGYYSRIKWNVSRTQFLTDTWSLTFDASGQMADKNLDSSEKFYLGGSSGVRAYPTSEGAGSEGYLMKLELRKYLPNNLTVSAFIDDGYIKQYKHNAKNSDPTVALTTEGSPNEYFLRGIGASVAWSGPYNTTLKATYAHRIGDNPNPSITDTGAVHDQDGVLRKNIFWLSGSIAF